MKLVEVLACWPRNHGIKKNKVIQLPIISQPIRLEIIVALLRKNKKTKIDEHNLHFLSHNDDFHLETKKYHFQSSKESFIN